MKQIQVSIDVFARIWALRKEGEESEDAILRRLLWMEHYRDRAPASASHDSQGGIVDHRFGVHFREGFEIERIYLGEPFRAVVQDGQWALNGQRSGLTRLNELSRAIGTRVENAWVNWFYNDADGRRRPASDLRDPARITSRRDGGSEVEKGIDKTLLLDQQTSVVRRRNIRWCDDVKTALLELGGRAPLHSIYRHVEKIRRKAGRSVPPSLEATIRRTLEDYSSDSENYRGEDWFKIAEGKGSGVWALRKESNT